MLHQTSSAQEDFSPETEANDNGSATLAGTDLTLAQLQADIRDAEDFLSHLRETTLAAPEKGLVSTVQPDWAPKLIRRHGIAGAVIEKAGSRNFVKRRPEDPAAFQAYVGKQEEAMAPLLFRVGFGPLKNVNLCGCRQNPDWAEYLALAQLARFLHAIAGVYPHGVRAQIVPDDLRSSRANRCPETYIAQYISGLKKLAEHMGLADVVAIENGQSRIYAQYDVPSRYAAAETALKTWRAAEPEAFAARWETALENAGKNLPCALNRTAEDIEASAWNYLVAHRAEVLSGVWNPGDAFPLRYANHANSYQIYTIGFKKTKLPWQIELPLSLVGDAPALSA